MLDIRESLQEQDWIQLDHSKNTFDHRVFHIIFTLFRMSEGNAVDEKSDTEPVPFQLRNINL